MIKVVIKVFVAKSGANESMRGVLMGMNKRSIIVLVFITKRFVFFSIS